VTKALAGVNQYASDDQLPSAPWKTMAQPEIVKALQMFCSSSPTLGSAGSQSQLKTLRASWFGGRVPSRSAGEGGASLPRQGNPLLAQFGFAMVTASR
jgi:hypothetical protein